MSTRTGCAVAPRTLPLLLLLLLVLTVEFLSASVVSAQPKSTSVTRVANNPVVCPLQPSIAGLASKGSSGLLCLDGAIGQWFPLPAARRMLKDLQVGRAAIALQPKLERRIELEVQRVILLELDVATSDKIAEQWRKAAEVQAKVLAQKDSFWRSPALWFAVGTVVTGAALISAAAATK